MTQSVMASHSSSDEEPLKETGAFGELVTMYHNVNIEKDEGCPYFENEKGNGKHMIVVHVVYTQWLQAYPVPRKDHESVLDRVLTYFGPEYHPNYSGPGGNKVPSGVYSDNANAFNTTVRGLHWLADTCTLTGKRLMA